MLWRTYLLNRLIWTRDIRFVIWRHPVVYAKVLIQYTSLFLLLFLVYRIVKLWIPQDLSQMIFGGTIGLLYIVAIFMLLRSYFDVMVATDDHLYIVLWDSFLKYRIKILTRSSIQDLTVAPAAWVSALLKDSHIIIATEQDELLEFHHVYKAAYVVKDMYEIRDRHMYPEQHVESEEEEPVASIDDEKFKVLVETLGEVIVDYMKKKQ